MQPLILHSSSRRASYMPYYSQNGTHIVREKNLFHLVPAQEKRLRNVLNKPHMLMPNEGNFSLGHLQFSFQEFESFLRKAEGIRISDSYLVNEAAEHVIGNIEYSVIEICFCIQVFSLDALNKCVHKFICNKMEQAKIKFMHMQDRDELIKSDYFFKFRISEITPGKGFLIDFEELKIRLLFLDERQPLPDKWAISLTTHLIQHANGNSINENIRHLKLRKLFANDLQRSQIPVFTFVRKMTQGFTSFLDPLETNEIIKKFTDNFSPDDFEKLKEGFLLHQRRHYPTYAVPKKIKGIKAPVASTSAVKMHEIARKQLEDSYNTFYFRACYEFVDTDRTLPAKDMRTRHKECVDNLKSQYLEIWKNIAKLTFIIEKPINIFLLMKEIGDELKKHLTVDLKRVFTGLWSRVDVAKWNIQTELEGVCGRAWDRMNPAHDALLTDIGPQLLNCIGPALLDLPQERQQRILSFINKFLKLNPTSFSKLEHTLRLMISLDVTFKKLNKIKCLQHVQTAIPYEILTRSVKCQDMKKAVECLNLLTFFQHLQKSAAEAYGKYCRSLATVWKTQKPKPQLLENLMSLIIECPEYTQELLVVVQGLFFFAWTQKIEGLNAYSFSFLEHPQKPSLQIQIRSAYLAIFGNPIEMTVEFLRCYVKLVKIFHENERHYSFFINLPKDLNISVPALTKDNIKIYSTRLAEGFMESPISEVLKIQYQSTLKPKVFYKQLQENFAEHINPLVVERCALSCEIQSFKKIALDCQRHDILEHIPSMVQGDITKEINRIHLILKKILSIPSNDLFVAMLKPLLFQCLSVHFQSLLQTPSSSGLKLVLEIGINTSFFLQKEGSKVASMLFDAYKKIGFSKDRIPFLIEADNLVRLSENWMLPSDELYEKRSRLKLDILNFLSESFPPFDSVPDLKVLLNHLFLNHSPRLRIQEINFDQLQMSVYCDFVVGYALRNPTAESILNAAKFAISTYQFCNHSAEQISELYLLARQFFYSSHMDPQEGAGLFVHRQTGLDLLVLLANKNPGWDKQKAIQSLMITEMFYFFILRDAHKPLKVFKMFVTAFSNLDAANIDYRCFIKCLKKIGPDLFAKKGEFILQGLRALKKDIPFMAGIIASNQKLLDFIPEKEREKLMWELIKDFPIPKTNEEVQVLFGLWDIAKSYSQYVTNENMNLVRVFQSIFILRFLSECDLGHDFIHKIEEIKKYIIQNISLVSKLLLADEKLMNEFNNALKGIRDNVFASEISTSLSICKEESQQNEAVVELTCDTSYETMVKCIPKDAQNNFELLESIFFQLPTIWKLYPDSHAQVEAFLNKLQEEKHLQNVSSEKRLLVLKTLSELPFKDFLQDAWVEIQLLTEKQQFLDLCRQMCLSGEIKLILLVYNAFRDSNHKDLSMCTCILEGCAKISNPLILESLEQEVLKNNPLVELFSSKEEKVQICSHLFEYVLNILSDCNDTKKIQHYAGLINREMNRLHSILPTLDVKTVWKLIKFLLPVYAKTRKSSNVDAVWQLLHYIYAIQDEVITSNEIDSSLNLLLMLKAEHKPENLQLFTDFFSALLHRIALTYKDAKERFSVLNREQQEKVSLVLKHIHGILGKYPPEVFTTYLSMFLRQAHLVVAQFIREEEVRDIAVKACRILDAQYTSLQKYVFDERSVNSKFNEISRYVCLSSIYKPEIGRKLLLRFYAKICRLKSDEPFKWFGALLNLAIQQDIYKDFNDQRIELEKKLKQKILERSINRKNKKLT